MADMLFQNTFFVILLISLLIAIGLGALYSVYATRHKILPSTARRRRVISIMGVILPLLGMSFFVGMLLLRLKRDGTLISLWTLGFVIGFVLATGCFVGVFYYAARRSIRMFLDKNGNFLP
jgi:hypothetical protein